MFVITSVARDQKQVPRGLIQTQQAENQRLLGAQIRRS
jgi:hypothetical protein